MYGELTIKEQFYYLEAAMARIRAKHLAQTLLKARPNPEENIPQQSDSGALFDHYNARGFSDLGISSVFASEGYLKNFDRLSKDSIEEMRAETSQLIKSSIDFLKVNHRISVGSRRDTINGLMDQILSNNEVLRHLVNIRCVDDYTFSHSVNVCILSLMTATSLGYTLPQLNELAIGSILHDVGKITVGQYILQKHAALDTSETAIIRAHPRAGYEMLRESQGIPAPSAYVSLQHHERWDGKGYPRRLSANAIHEYARITSVADVYDALLTDRPYRPRYSVEHAVDIINSMSDSLFEPRILSALFDNITPIPIGSIVTLSSGQIGIVIDTNKKYPTYPIVKVMFDKSFHDLDNPCEIDLSQLRAVFVSLICSDKDVLNLLSSF